MSTRRHRTGDQDQDEQRSGGSGVAPGKRTMTGSLPPARDTADFDRSSDYMESRATIDSAAPTTSRLTDRQLRKARERNPHWQGKLGFSPSLFGGGDVATGEFADNVADKQAGLGLSIDGIAGPNTLDAVIKGNATTADDPFGMHLIDKGSAGRSRSGSGGRRGHAGKPAGKSADQPAAEAWLRGEVTDVQPKDDGVQLVIGAGANDGVDESWRIHVLGCNLPWKVTEVRPNATVVVSRRGHIDDVLGLNQVDLKGVPRAAEEAPSPATDATDANDEEPAWWTFED